MEECPTCGRDDFSREQDIKTHHAKKHGESLVNVELTCSNCGDHFKRPEYDVVDAENYYCSYECRKNIGEYKCPYDGCEYTSDSTFGIKQHHKRSHGESLTVKTVSCDYCGNSFQKQRSKLRRFDGTFCSPECRTNHLAEKLSESRNGESNPMYGMTGEKHHNFKGGYSQSYGSGWLSQRRKAIERDNEQCQDCGMTRNEHYDEFGADLEVHHKTPIRTFNDKSEANKLSNLITLCTNCHIQAEHS